MSTLFPSVCPTHVQAAAELTEVVVFWDGCAVLTGDAGAGVAAVLDRVKRTLSGRGVRCVRVHGPSSGALSLPHFMTQVVGRADPGTLTQDDLDAGLEALIEPGEGYDRVVLLVDGPHGLSPAVMRYLQLVCRCGPRLRVVMAGGADLEALLAYDEFADLRGRITHRLALPGSVAHVPPDPASIAPDPAPRSTPWKPTTLPDPEPQPSPVPAARRRVRSWMLAGLGLAASLGVLAWTVRGSVALSPVVTMRANTPAPSR